LLQRVLQFQSQLRRQLAELDRLIGGHGPAGVEPRGEGVDLGTALARRVALWA
jgi:hypothetical protein